MPRCTYDDGMPASIKDVLESLINGDQPVTAIHRVTKATRHSSLWANYGSIWRINVDTDGASLPKSLILKLISPPTSKKGASPASDEGHIRKLLSYRVESNFYSQVYPNLGGTEACPCAPFVSASRDESFVQGDEGLEALLIGDLSQDYPVFGERRGELDPTQTRTALSWLANFHAAAWGYEGPLCPTPERFRREGWHVEAKEKRRMGVWERGGYSYLATRKAELASIDPGSTWGRAGLGGDLAHAVDHALSRRDQPGLTLTHGDCKAANMAFSPDGRRMAAFDFQYVGVGVGALDLAKFLTTSVEEGELDDEEGLLRLYWGQCCQALRRRGKGGPEDHGWTWEAFSRQWELALIDWVRFQAGWGFWGHVDWLEERAKGILDRPGWKEELLVAWNGASDGRHSDS